MRLVSQAAPLLVPSDSAYAATLYAEACDLFERVQAFAAVSQTPFRAPWPSPCRGRRPGPAAASPSRPSVAVPSLYSPSALPHARVCARMCAWWGKSRWQARRPATR